MTEFLNNKLFRNLNIRSFIRKLKILINELVADPEDGPEWVENYNAGNLSVDLEGWYLEEGSEQKTKLSGTIIPEQFIVVQNIEGSLNNAGDIVRLKNEKGEMTDRVTFGTWEDGTPSDNAPFASDPNSVARQVDGKDTFTPGKVSGQSTGQKVMDAFGGKQAQEVLQAR